MLSKSLIQFSVGGWGRVPSRLFDLRPQCGGGDDDNGDLLQKAPARAVAPSVPSLQQATAAPHLHRRPRGTHGKSGSVPSVATAPSPRSWCSQGFACALPESVPILCKFWQLYGGLMASSSKRARATPRSAAPRAPAPAAVPC